LFVSCILFLGVARAQDSRSDTFDITHIHLNLDLSDIPGKVLVGHAHLNIRANIAQPHVLPLDLLKLSVDSVRINGMVAAFTYNDTLIRIALPPLTVGDTFVSEVFYSGTPVTDATGWGGFFFTGGFAFNIGVGFAADPHNFGRVWFPCFDNFIEKSSYSMSVITASTDKAVCSGRLDSSSAISPSKMIWHYSMEEPIPSYLTSVAVASFEIIEWMHQGPGGNVPVRIAATPTDTGKITTTFINLLNAMQAFENSYGPVKFDRVGYCIVPFTGGAMEHPTNIAYPRFAMTSTTQYDHLMAHELSHHWWGDQVTCSTPEDMWINEGWASYSEHLFSEHLQGHDGYKQAVRANHRSVLQLAHVRDDGYRAVSGVPHAYTYGSTVYDKGADVAHTLRGYLGDSVFFHCIKGFLDDFGFASVSSEDLRDYLTTCSGTDMNPFFEGWVFNPGFPHFSIDSVKSTWDGFGYVVSVYVRQRLNNAPAYFDDIPLDITFMGQQFQRKTERMIMSDRCGIYHTWLNFNPVFAALDMEERISDAITDEYHVFTSTGSHDFADALMDVTVNAISGDSALLRIEHNWVPPDRMKQPLTGLILSDYRYWKVDGVWQEPLDVSTIIRFNGTTTTAGHLDNGLITNSEDSLVLMYRLSPKADWSIYPHYVLNTQGSANNKIGRMEISKLLKGEYTLAIWDRSRTDHVQSDIPDNCADLNVGTRNLTPSVFPLQAFPNPADHTLHLQVGTLGWDSCNYRVSAPDGTTVSTGVIQQLEAVTLSTQRWASGWYIITLEQDGSQLASVKVFIVH